MLLPPEMAYQISHAEGLFVGCIPSRIDYNEGRTASGLTWDSDFVDGCNTWRKPGKNRCTMMVGKLRQPMVHNWQISLTRTRVPQTFPLEKRWASNEIGQHHGMYPQYKNNRNYRPFHSVKIEPCENLRVETTGGGAGDTTTDNSKSGIKLNNTACPRIALS